MKPRFFWDSLGRICAIAGIAIAVLATTMAAIAPAPALASVHRYPMPDGGVMDRSLLNLRDTGDRGWQVVAFRQVAPDGRVKDLRLRLVAFPGLALDRDRPLEIRDPAGGQRAVANEFPLPDRVPNAGEYDVGPLLRSLDRAIPLRLWVPLSPETARELGSDRAELPVPPYAVDEWLQVTRREP